MAELEVVSRGRNTKEDLLSQAVVCPSELRGILAEADSSIRDQKLGEYISRQVSENKIAQAQEALPRFANPDMRESSLNEIVGSLLREQRLSEAEDLVEKYGIAGRTEGILSIIADAYIERAERSEDPNLVYASLVKAKEICSGLVPDLNRDFQLGVIGFRAASIGQNDLAKECLARIADTDTNVRDDVYGALAAFNIKANDLQTASVFCEKIKNPQYRAQMGTFINNPATTPSPELGKMVVKLII